MADVLRTITTQDNYHTSLSPVVPDRGPESVDHDDGLAAAGRGVLALVAVPHPGGRRGGGEGEGGGARWVVRFEPPLQKIFLGCHYAVKLQLQSLITLRLSTNIFSCRSMRPLGVSRADTQTRAHERRLTRSACYTRHLRWSQGSTAA